MTKEKFIEFVQDHLANQTTVDDLMDKLHWRDISDMIGIVYAQLVNEIKSRAKDQSRNDWMSVILVPYSDIAVVKTGTQYSTDLPVLPLSGPKSIFINRCDCDDVFKYRTHTESIMMKVLKDSQNATYTLVGTKVVWDKDPKVDTVNITMIPDFQSMDDNVEFQLPIGHESVFLDMLVQKFRKKETVKEETQNDQKVDL